MYKSTFTLLAIVASSVAWTVPVEYVEERHVVEIQKRQADVAQLLNLASLAGITALPTDPAALLKLGPMANSLASALPTPSVLSVLLTAAPSGFVSNIVNDQSYANSFQSAFAAGSSPSWFNGLPTDVRSYLHTYSGFGGLATAAGNIKGAATSSAGAEATGSTSDSASASSAMSGSSAASGSMDSSASMASGSSMTASSGMTMSTLSSAAQDAASSASAAAAGQSSSADAGAARPTGAIAAGLAGAAGILAVAVAL